MKLIALIVALGLVSTAAHAEIVESTPNGFGVRHQLVIDGPAQTVYDALIKPGTWWNAQHTWSGDAKNMTIDAHPGGCFCEALPNNGGIEHLRVVSVQPGKGLRMFGGLGPLQFTGASGFLNVSLTEKDGKTTFTATYDVGGYAKGGLDKWSQPVDGVLAEQYGRLKAAVEGRK
ncbi:ATPase [Asticcacaulis sp. BYS171W]|uniref:ATPase n=1 Tax=Asticcacaulis aquaticus TaxID=2984212 RepID=A0ABT5HP95_9CAUL|nr:ATPase [Asticcacaulis aquaticus]MDC7681880.1 ATPase [Asticcacaulis aquaticus]